MTGKKPGEGVKFELKSNSFFTKSYNKEERIKLIKNNISVEDFIRQADEILQGNLSFLGVKIKHDFSNWNYDHVHKYQWQNAFYIRLIDDLRKARCDVKYIWEVNRHQYLIVLGKAYLLTGDEKYAEKALTTIQDWITKNPYKTVGLTGQVR